MAIPKSLSTNPYDILAPDDRWRPGDENLTRLDTGELMPPLVENVRKAVKKWRDNGYPNVSETTRALLAWWFVSRPEGAISYYFSQREAVESVVYLYEAEQIKDKYNLLRFSAGNVTPEMISEHWRRYVIKMATGSGKTKVISLLVAWSYFHKLYEQDSPLSRNILLIAPNIIVLDRLSRDFQNMKIFYEDNVIPPNGFEGRDWEGDFQMQMHRQNEVRSHSDAGNLFLTNIHRVYVRDLTPPSVDDENVKDYFLGPRPSGGTMDDRIDLGEVVRELDELLVINDEAHHIHDENMAWFKTIEDLHNTLLQKGRALSLQVDMTATPKHNNGAIFVQTISDYPLVEAIHQNVVKRPVIPDEASEQKMEERTSTNYCERFSDYIHLGVVEWRKAFEEHKKTGHKAVLFLMTDDTKNCDLLGRYMQDQYRDLTGKVLVIHTKRNGEITEASGNKKDKELEDLRKQAATIDHWDNPYRAIVSVLVLREGWDVRNVTTIVGLRAYSARSNILPEQTLGRGLRLMYPESNDCGEKVSIIGSSAFVEFVKKIEQEGVELERVFMSYESPAQTSLIISIDHGNPEKDIKSLDITVPVLSPRFSSDPSKITGLRAENIPCVTQPYRRYSPDELREIIFRDILSGEISHITNLINGMVEDHSRIVGYFAREVMRRHNFFSHYDFFYEVMRDFIRDHLFGKRVDLDKPDTARNLAEPAVSKAIFDGFDKAIRELLRLEKFHAEILRELKVSDMSSFPAGRSDSPPYRPAKCAQNYIVGDSSLEYDFAKFLDRCADVPTFAKNYPKVNFYLDYVNKDGRVAKYYPDFLVRSDEKIVWIVETKGRKDENDFLKERRLRDWCETVRRLTKNPVVHPLWVDEENYRRHRPRTFADLISLCSPPK